MKKRSECTCACHKPNWNRNPIIHLIPCCEPDEVEMKDELKPCPFCGGEPIIDWKPDYLRIRCESCCTESNVYSFNYTYDEKDVRRAENEVIKAWNTRTASNTDTIKSAFSPELCAQQILDEAIADINNARKEQYRIAMFTEGEVKNGFDMSIEVLEKLKEKYNDR